MGNRNRASHEAALDAPVSQIFTQVNLAHGSFALFRRVRATSAYPPKLTVKAEMAGWQPCVQACVKTLTLF